MQRSPGVVKLTHDGSPASLLLTPATLVFAGSNQEKAMKHSILKMGLPLLAALAAGCTSMGTGSARRLQGQTL